MQQDKQPHKLWQWRGVVEKKAHRGRIWKVLGNEQFIRGFTRKGRSKEDSSGSFTLQ